MKLTQIHIKTHAELDSKIAQLKGSSAQLVVVFGAVEYFAKAGLAQALKLNTPQAALFGCSTAGEIAVDRVYDHSCIVTAINFEDTQVKSTTTLIANMDDSFNAGARLAKALPAENLAGVLVLGTGVAINGSALVKGLESALPKGTPISGGLAADAGAFAQTWTLSDQGCSDKHLVAVGLYGKKVSLSYGTFAGWEPFGPARKVTRCEGNVLFELDGERALDVYKRYLGSHAKDLPGSGLLFPFEMLDGEHQKQGIFRTILGISDAEGSLTLAGDIDPNGYLKLMHSSTEKLINGAETAAKTAQQNHTGTPSTALAILVSCIGRKLVMGDRIDEEVEAVADTLGKNTTITGYYSNGEIAGTSFSKTAEGSFLGECRLHNQTMTITWISE